MEIISGIRTLDGIDVNGKTVLCRLDLNSPLDREGNLSDTTRIRRCTKTIQELSGKGAKLVLMSHQGGDLEYKNYSTTEKHAGVIEQETNIPVRFIDDVCGPAARESIVNLKNGEVLLLDNVRYMAEELTLFETKMNLSFKQQADTLLVNKLAPLADLFVCDAFAAAHRSQPSLSGFPMKLPSAMGRLFEAEISVLSGILENPARPSLFILGGSKVQDAFMMMSKVLQDNVADRVLTGGLVANIMLMAQGKDIGKPSEDFIHNSGLTEYIDTSKKLLTNYGSKISVPEDLAYVKDVRAEINVNDLPINKKIVDLGTKTTQQYIEIINQSNTIFVNGPVGVYENPQSLYGTKTLFEAVASSKAFSVIGGGDSISVISTLGLENSFSYICTGGGAMVRFLSGEELPVIQALKLSTSRHFN